MTAAIIGACRIVPAWLFLRVTGACMGSLRTRDSCVLLTAYNLCTRAHATLIPVGLYRGERPLLPEERSGPDGALQARGARPAWLPQQFLQTALAIQVVASNQNFFRCRFTLAVLVECKTSSGAKHLAYNHPGSQPVLICCFYVSLIL
jgi:hypothetical protein